MVGEQSKAPVVKLGRVVRYSFLGGGPIVGAAMGLLAAAHYQGGTRATLLLVLGFTALGTLVGAGYYLFIHFLLLVVVLSGRLRTRVREGTATPADPLRDDPKGH
jgi:hypothetical protein